MRREFGTRDTDLTGCVDRISLARAMTELPPGYRTIFLLHEVEGYEHKEIAEMLGCSVGNSKSQLHKAKLRIRELLARSVEERLRPRGTLAARNVHRQCALWHGAQHHRTGACQKICSCRQWRLCLKSGRQSDLKTGRPKLLFLGWSG